MAWKLPRLAVPAIALALAVLSSYLSAQAAPDTEPVAPEVRKQAHERRHEWVRPDRHDPSDQSFGSTPFLLGLRSKKLLTTSDLACRSSAIVEGVIRAAESTISSTDDFVFTDYAFRVEKVLKPRGGKPLGPEITVTRVGGAVHAGSQKRSFRSKLLPPLEVDRRYLLFLTAVEGSDSFAADVPGGTLLLVDSGEAAQVDGLGLVRELPRPGANASHAAVIAALQAAVGGGCAR
jgi:hypothetical protein